MGKYIGVMQHFATFYNFKPLVEIERNGSLSLMDDADRERLLPESKNLNINIYYNVYDTAQAERAKNMFDNDRVLVLEFVPDDLQTNLTPDGRRNATGYKIPFQTAINTGKLHFLQMEGLYFVLRKGDLLSDFRNSAIVQLEKVRMENATRCLLIRTACLQDRIQWDCVKLTMLYTLNPIFSQISIL